MIASKWPTSFTDLWFFSAGAIDGSCLQLLLSLVAVISDGNVIFGIFIAFYFCIAKWTYYSLFDFLTHSYFTNSCINPISHHDQDIVEFYYPFGLQKKFSAETLLSQFHASLFEWNSWTHSTIFLFFSRNSISSGKNQSVDFRTGIRKNRTL